MRGRTTQAQCIAPRAVLEHGLRAAIKHNPPGVHQQHAIGMLDSTRQAVLDHDDGDAVLLPEPDQDIDDAVDVGGVQGGRRLIQDENLGTHGEHRGDGHDLLLPAGKLGWFAVAQRGETGGGQRPRRPGAHLVLRQTQVARSESHLVFHAQVEELRTWILEDDSHPLADVRQGVLLRIHVRNRDPPANLRRDGVRNDAADHLGQRALATAGRPSDQHPLAGFHMERDPGQGGYIVIMHAEFLHPDHRPSPPIAITRAEGQRPQARATNAGRITTQADR